MHPVIKKIGFQPNRLAAFVGGGVVEDALFDSFVLTLDCEFDVGVAIFFEDGLLNLGVATGHPTVLLDRDATWHGVVDAIAALDISRVLRAGNKREEGTEYKNGFFHIVL